MIPKDQLSSKPIELRNPCIFYAGHIPTFLDIHLTRATKEPYTQPSNYTKIFERGIDPDVEDPTHCHRHSEIPNAWPDITQIMEYQLAVRSRLSKIYDEKHFEGNVGLQRSIWLGFEHEVLHLETLLYMLLQHSRTLPPPGVPLPDFEAMAALDDSINKEEENWIDIPAFDIKMGTSQDEDNGGYFTWDNETPERSAKIASFKAFPRPITNAEYARYLETTNSASYPESWASKDEPATNGISNGVTHAHYDFMEKKYIKTVFGLVPLKYARHWPVMASYDELAGCVQWMGGRIPTRQELQVIYEYLESVKVNWDAKKLSATFNAVNG